MGTHILVCGQYRAAQSEMKMPRASIVQSFENTYNVFINPDNPLPKSLSCKGLAPNNFPAAEIRITKSL